MLFAALNNSVKSLWRWWTRLRLKKLNVTLSRKVKFNRLTVFEGYNVVSGNSIVGNSYIGKYTYMGDCCKLSNCKIGRFTSIGSNVKVISYTHPSHSFISTSPVFLVSEKQAGKSFVKTQIFEETLTIDDRNAIIGNDVWIGDDVIIKGGITIGDGAIIAMGAVVVKDVAPYSIVGGVPAKLIGYRFSENEIQRLEEIQWWNRSDEWLESNVSKFSNITNLGLL